MKLIKKCVLVGSMAISGVSFAGNVATIGGKHITEEDYKQALRALGPNAAMVAGNPEMRVRFLDHLIDSQLLSAKATQDKLADSADFKARMEQTKNQILAEMALDAHIKSNTKDADLKKHFEANKKDFAKDEVQASHILMKEEAEAKKVLAEALKKGADFAALAKKHSTDPSGAENGGDLGWFGRGRMVPEFETVAFATAKNTIHPNLVKSQFGFHIIKVVDKKDGSGVKFEEVKDEVMNRMSRDLRTKLTEELRKSAKIEVNKDLLSNMKI